MKLTKWVNSHTLPIRRGVYQRDYGYKKPKYSYWDGFQWYFGASDPDTAVRVFKFNGNFASSVMMLRWRGLAEPPT